MDYTTEIWKTIKGFEDYEISNFGRVKSNLNRFINKGSFIMNTDKSSKGYERVQLSKPIRKRFLIHRLVAEHFIENLNNYNVVNHLDNNPSNNHVDNLEWTTTSGNLIHAQKQNRLFKAQSKGGKITSQKARNIAIENADNLIGKKFGNLEIIQNNGFQNFKTYTLITVNCKCNCGNIENNIKLPQILKGSRTKCTECTYNEIKEKRHSEIVKEITNKIVDGYTLTGHTNFYTDNKPIMRYLKIESICNNCKNIVWHPYHTLISTDKHFKHCPFCFER